MSRQRRTANKAARDQGPSRSSFFQSSSFDQAVFRSSFGQRGKHRLWGVGDHGEKGARRPARQALALLPVADSLNGNPEPACELQLGQARAAAQVAHRRGCDNLFRRDRSCPRSGGGGRRRSERRHGRERKFLPVPQFDDPSVGFQSQALHVPPDFKTRSGTTKPKITFADRAPNSRLSALRFD
jgi:hypothetical protein